jgi:hypothetical protein
MATVMVEAATLRSGYDLKDSAGFADRIESVLRRAMGVSADEKVEDEPNDDEADLKFDTPTNDDDENIIDDDTDSKVKKETKSKAVCKYSKIFFFPFNCFSTFRMLMKCTLISRKCADD